MSRSFDDIRCGACGEPVEFEEHNFYRGTSDKVVTVAPCCIPTSALPSMEDLQEYLLDVTEENFKNVASMIKPFIDPEELEHPNEVKELRSTLEDLESNIKEIREKISDIAVYTPEG